ncbi:MAG: hypothetical protein ABI263_09280 [Gelidibacter sp.]
MKSFITKLKSAFGESKVGEEPHDDTFTEAIINDVEGAPYALSKTNVLYAGLSELAGYHYFKTIIIGTFQIKTFKGAKLVVNGKDFKLELKSDMEELESESSNIPNRNITRIDFEIEHKDLSKISKKVIESLELIALKNHVHFSIIQGDFDEELADETLADDSLTDDAVHQEGE